MSTGNILENEDYADEGDVEMQAYPNQQGDGSDMEDDYVFEDEVPAAAAQFTMPEELPDELDDDDEDGYDMDNMFQ